MSTEVNIRDILSGFVRNEERLVSAILNKIKPKTDKLKINGDGTKFLNNAGEYVNIDVESSYSEFETIISNLSSNVKVLSNTIKINGDGTKFLNDKGKYVNIGATPEIISTLSSNVDKLSGDTEILFSNVESLSDIIKINGDGTKFLNDNGKYVNIDVEPSYPEFETIISDLSSDVKVLSDTIKINGDGTKFLNNAGEYVNIGTTPEIISTLSSNVDKLSGDTEILSSNVESLSSISIKYILFKIPNHILTTEKYDLHLTFSKTDKFENDNSITIKLSTDYNKFSIASSDGSGFINLESGEILYMHSNEILRFNISEIDKDYLNFRWQWVETISSTRGKFGYGAINGSFQTFDLVTEEYDSSNIFIDSEESTEKTIVYNPMLGEQIIYIENSVETLKIETPCTVDNLRKYLKNELTIHLLNVSETTIIDLPDLINQKLVDDINSDRYLLVLKGDVAIGENL